MVVGYGEGMGAAIARRFARGGFTMGLVARRAEAVAEGVRSIEAEGGSAQGFPADAADPTSLRSALAAAAEALGPPSVLAYNVGVVAGGKPSELDPERLVESLRPNVVGALVATQAVLPAMRAAGRGTVLLTGGGLALSPAPDFAALAIGKAGIRNLSLSLSKELEPEGIHVATVTIKGFVEAGTRFDPDEIAERYWQLHEEPAGSWTRELEIA